VLIIETHSEHRSGKNARNSAFNFYCLLTCHA
jgi:hypothetical protein